MRDCIRISKNNYVMVKYIQLGNLIHQLQKFNLQYKGSHLSYISYVQVLLLITKITNKLEVQGGEVK